VAEAEARLSAVEVQGRYYARQATRLDPLVAAGAETQDRRDQLHSELDQSSAQARQLKAALANARQNDAVFAAQRKQALAQIAQAEAQAAQAQIDLASTVILAARSGRVGDRSVRAGQYVQPGVKLLSIVPVSAIYLVANFKETQLAHMRIGQPVKVAVDALGGRTLDGVVDSFAPGTGAQFALIPPNNATGNFTKIVQRVPVRIRFTAKADERQVLVPGMSATIGVDTRSAPR
jgi:membrane fusion protein (multidrug efflux system)